MPTDHAARLAAPFELREVKFKPQSVKGNRALALAYVDCRLIQDRLDQVLGVEGWADEYQFLADGSVMCKLSLNFGGSWVAKTDVGSPSEQPDGGDRLKAAVSDALKRAAVKFGIGRYLYRLQPDWVDYDPAKRKFTSQPQLPGWALPGAAAEASDPNSGTPTAADIDALILGFDSVGDEDGYSAAKRAVEPLWGGLSAGEREGVTLAANAAARRLGGPGKAPKAAKSRAGR